MKKAIANFVAKKLLNDAKREMTSTKGFIGAQKIPAELKK